MSSSPLRVVAIIGSFAEGRTSTVVDAVVAGAGAAAATEVDRVVLGEHDLAGLPARLAGGECFVIGTPMYRATYTGLLKTLLDQTPRGLYDEGTPPFRARPVAVVGTGASAHHFLGIDPLIALLVRFFGAYIVPPGLYAEHASFGPDGELLEPVAGQADAFGRVLAELALTIRGSSILQGAGPQV
jgi:FMN reductase